MEISRPWDGTTIGDAGPYTSDQWSGIYRGMTGNASDSGVMWTGDTDNFGITIASNSVTIGTGKAMVYGRYYENNAEVSLPFSTPVGTRYDRVVLRATWIDNKVRLVYREGVDDGGVPPALNQTAGSVWEIPLWIIRVGSTYQEVYLDTRQIWGHVALAYDNYVDIFDGPVTQWEVSGLPASCSKIRILTTIQTNYNVSPVELHLQLNGMNTDEYDYNLNGTPSFGEPQFVLGDLLTTGDLAYEYSRTFTIDLFPMMIGSPAYPLTNSHKIWFASSGIGDDVANLQNYVAFGVAHSVAKTDISILLRSSLGEFESGSKISVYLYA